MKIKITILLCTFFALNIKAQTNNGKSNIEKLCGCFSVNFKYAETFSPVDTYKRHEHDEQNAMELALAIESTDNKVVIQHLLLINDTMVIKHWREEWVYESLVVYEYAGNKVWKRKPIAIADAKNKWVQTVWEVNDEPRYQGISAWINNDGKIYWESTADAPLPRREYTTRNDYNVLKRRNRIVITADGYIHEQDNEKIIRNTDMADKLLVQEKGYNTYYKADETECEVARKWWKKNEAFWAVVRKEWMTAIEGTGTVAVKAKVDNKKLDEYLMPIWKEWDNKKITLDELSGRVKDVLKKFL